MLPEPWVSVEDVARHRGVGGLRHRGGARAALRRRLDDRISSAAPTAVRMGAPRKGVVLAMPAAARRRTARRRLSQPAPTPAARTIHSKDRGLQAGSTENLTDIASALPGGHRAADESSVRRRQGAWESAVATPPHQVHAKVEVRPT